MSDSNKFYVLPASDKFYIETVQAVCDSLKVGIDKVSVPGTSIRLQELSEDESLRKAIDTDMPLYESLTFLLNDRRSISIRRGKDPTNLFDEVTINRDQQVDFKAHALLTAEIRLALNARSPSSIGEVLTPALRHHYEQREIALSRLETLTSDLVVSLEEDRRRKEKLLEEKSESLELRSQEKEKRLEKEYQARMEELHKREQDLANFQKELDDREAKHARRQHYKDLKSKFANFSDKFSTTAGTQYKRVPVHIFVLTILTVALYNILAGFGKASSLTGDENPVIFWFLAARLIASSIVFGTTAIYYAKWMSHWFQRHANEEFRLKRLELDLDRASWFVELAFQWKDENGEPIPHDLTECLTRNLFTGGVDEKAPDHPVDLLAAGFTKLQVTPQGATLEVDRRKRIPNKPVPAAN